MSDENTCRLDESDDATQSNVNPFDDPNGHRGEGIVFGKSTTTTMNFEKEQGE